MATFTGYICTDCAPLAINGDDSNLEFDDAKREAAHKGLDLAAEIYGQFFPSRVDDEPEFLDHNYCEVCDSHEPGDFFLVNWSN